MLEREFDYYRKHQAEYAKEHLGKFVVIKDDKVLGFFRSVSEAYEQTAKTYTPGTFLIEPCLPGPEAYTAKFGSRAIFTRP